MISHEGKDADKGTKGSSDFEQMADQVISLTAMRREFNALRATENFVPRKRTQQPMPIGHNTRTKLHSAGGAANV